MVEIPSKKLKNGFSMPVFGIGTWKMGGGKDMDKSNDDKADVSAIRSAVDMGVTHIDTAEIYADGYAEMLVAEAIKGYDRKKLFIVSKVAPYNLTYHGIIESARKSLKRLKTDYLDLYLIHAPNPDIPIKDSMNAMDFLLAEGLIKNIGVSNFSADRLEEAQSQTKNKIVANQVHYNLIFREMEKRGVLDYCQQNDVMLIAWRPVEKGALSSVGVDVVDKIAKKYGKTPAQVAINWLISQENVVTLAKSRNVEHLKENLGAIGWKMQDDEVELLRKEFPGQKDVSDAVPLI